MKVILTDFVASVGEPGKVVDVARGYARNFLIPQGKVLEATPGAVQNMNILFGLKETMGLDAIAILP